MRYANFLVFGHLILLVGLLSTLTVLAYLLLRYRVREWSILVLMFQRTPAGLVGILKGWTELQVMNAIYQTQRDTLNIIIYCAVFTSNILLLIIEHPERWMLLGLLFPISLGYKAEKIQNKFLTHILHVRLEQRSLEENTVNAEEVSRLFKTTWVIVLNYGLQLLVLLWHLITFFGLFGHVE